MTGAGIRREQWRFFKTADGGEVAKDEFRSLPIDGRALLADAMNRYRRGLLLDREFEHVAGDIYAIRVSSDSNHYRLLFSHEGPVSTICLCLTAIRKNQRKLPKEDLARARKRLVTWRANG